MNTQFLLRTLLLAPLRVAYAVWAIGAFVIVGLAVLLLLLLLPREVQRRSAARAAARVFLSAAGMPLTVTAVERLPPGQCVVVCNHASYLDGIVLTAALPPRFAFVIKREMADFPMAGALLKRLGSQFVERTDRQKSAVDARRVLRNASLGQSVVFFPEGTFIQQPGLHKFHSGAFVTAARVGCALVPAVVRGTRRALPPGLGMPRPARIELELLPALHPLKDGIELGVSALRDRARSDMLAALGEPDLTCCDDTDRLPDIERARSAPASRL